ncbi:hypothetical protein K4B79_18935 [Streptomyces lincolnensis]|uniref:hypothetical protein n=1 Tax=Streptomyces lincolnensis TaxID=1915 RepID=UPI001E407470|nr:hypothetical protein [Streptomyces lincolnensis]MCD7440292.1 hypothetical protein [Streptomyces lincolnensis]
MSAYSRVYQALTSGRALRPGEAAQLLAELRKETGTELAAAVEQQLDGKFRRAATDSDAAFRKKQRAYSASMRVVNAVRRLAAAPLRPVIPNPRDNRSTT